MANENVWYVAHNGQSIGPMTHAELLGRLPNYGGLEAMVYGPNMQTWSPAKSVPDVASRFRSPVEYASPSIPPPPGTRRADVIDYEIFGSEMQYVEVTLDPGEMVIAEGGAMMYMSPGIAMQTVFGDPSAQQKQGFLDKVMTAGKRVLTGESMFMTTFTAAGSVRDKIAFAAPYPGKIIALHLDQLGGQMVCQRDSFLCAARGVQISIAFQKKIGVGLFGGEGFIMQRLTGDGIALVHAGGTLMERELRAGEMLKVDTGCIVALQPSVNYDIQFVGGIKNTLFGGEGLFFATLTGPGKIWLQSLPFSRLAGRMMAASAGGKEQRSLLGNIGGILGDRD